MFILFQPRAVLFRKRTKISKTNLLTGRFFKLFLLIKIVIAMWNFYKLFQQQNKNIVTSLQQYYTINNIKIKMFEGQRLNYIVPGYTGHIPHKVYQDNIPLQQKQPTGKIPGYAGYVKAIKPQNIYANTYGKITLNVAQENYVKGQDVDAKDKYVSTQGVTCIPPSQMLQRTAADIVGVPNKTILVQAPTQFNKTGTQTDQFTLSKTDKFRQSLTKKDNKWANTKVVQKQGKQYVKLDNPIPGYTGFGKRVMANNIFGRTFAQCMKQSENDAQRLGHQKQKNFNNQLNVQPQFKF